MYIRYADQLSGLPGMTCSVVDSLQHSILSNASADLFSSAHIWFSISNAIIGLFDQAAQISLRPYLFDGEKKAVTEFSRICSDIVTEFMSHPVVLEMIQSGDHSKKRKPDDEVEDVKEPKRDAQTAMEKLKKAMESANLLLSKK